MTSESGKNIVTEKLKNQYQFSSEKTSPSSQNSNKNNYESNNDEGDTKKMYKYNKGITDAKSLEREVARLGRQGHTDQALFLYYTTFQFPTHLINKGNQLHAIPTTTRLMNVAIDACARARPPRVNEAFDLFEHAVHIDKRLTPNVFTFGALMAVCARGRDADRAIRLLNDMETKYNTLPNGVVYSTAISAAERSRPPRFKLALKLLNQMTESTTLKGEDFTIAYNTAISALARAGEYETAVSLLEIDMPKKGVLPDEVTFGTVMAACERCQKWELILKFAEKMENDPSLSHLNLKMDGITITTVLKACQKLGLANRALQYIAKFKELEATQQTNDFQNRKTRGKQRKGMRAQLTSPDDVAYCLAISACSRVGRINDALRLLDEIPKEKLSVSAYTAVIQGFAKTADYKAALSLLQDMKDSKNVQPNVVTYSTIISVCAAAVAKGLEAMVDEGDTHHYAKEPLKCAFDLLDEMKSRNIDPNIITYNALLKACAEAQAIDKAFHFADELIDKGLEPTIITFGTLMTACERVGNVEAAGKVFQKMKNVGVEPNEIVYGAAISCCRKGNEPERALLLLRKMIESPQLQPNTAVFNTVLMALTAGIGDEMSEQMEKNLKRALKVYRIMISTKHSTPISRPNRQTYSILLRATTLAKPPYEDDAEIILRDMKNAGYNPTVDQYAVVVSAFERSSPAKPLKALRLMEEMREEGFDFYENKVLNQTFKKLVKLVNAVTGPQSNSQ